MPLCKYKYSPNVHSVAVLNFWLNNSTDETLIQNRICYRVMSERGILAVRSEYNTRDIARKLNTEPARIQCTK